MYRFIEFCGYPPTLRLELYSDVDIDTFSNVYEVLEQLRAERTQQCNAQYLIDLRVKYPSPEIRDYLRRRGYIGVDLPDATCFSDSVKLSKL